MAGESTKQLPHPDQAHFDAALGWLLLGSPLEALAEFEKLSGSSRMDPDVLEIKWIILARAGRWNEAHDVAGVLVRMEPDRPFGWIHLAYCARRIPGGSLESAWSFLRPAFDRFPKEKIIPYNLACYAAQMGRLDEAWTWFLRAVDMAKDPRDLKALALADADLAPLRERILTM